MTRAMSIFANEKVAGVVVAVGALGPITAPVIYNYDTGRRVRP